MKELIICDFYHRTILVEGYNTLSSPSSLSVRQSGQFRFNVLPVTFFTGCLVLGFIFFSYCRVLLCKSFIQSFVFYFIYT